MRTKHQQKTSIDEKSSKTKVELHLFSWEEDGVFFIYSPALDLTGYGKSSQEATQSFDITLAETVQYMMEKSTLFDELERLGWLVNRRRKWLLAPDYETLLAESEPLVGIQAKDGMTQSTTSLELALV